MSTLKDNNILVIVESPNKCSTITNILKQAGYHKATVMASYGHIMELADGGSYYNSGVSPEQDFELNLRVSSDKHTTVQKLKAAAMAADLVYLMSDGDREGELITWSLIKFLDLPLWKCKRAITQEITPKAVVQAIENPIKISNELIDAALSRLTVDKMIGYTLSPVARSYVGAKSVGRCQSAGLKLVVEREKEIQEFKPEHYIELFLNFAKNETKFRAKYIGTDIETLERIKTAEELVGIKQAMAPDNYFIAEIINKQRRESPKPPFCTATFQQEASTRLGLKVKDAMSCAQKLFEGLNINGGHIGLITYMRTDATMISPEFLPVAQDYIQNTFGADAWVGPRAAKSVNTTAQEGHEALRVVDPSLTPEKLSAYIQNELLIKVYDLIWKRTIAACMPDAVFAETTYKIANGKHRFQLSSKVITSMGYRALKGVGEDDKEDCIKEFFTEGEKLQNCELVEEFKQTQPPARYKEASLIKELQKRDIGRPSTYVTIVETLLSQTRGYAELQDKHIVPTSRGIQLAAFLDRSFSNVISLDYTRELEAQLDQIASGKVSKLEFLKSFHKMLDESLEKNTETLGVVQPRATAKCPNCGSDMVVRRSRYGRLFYGCSQYPKCTGIINIK